MPLVLSYNRRRWNEHYPRKNKTKQNQKTATVKLDQYRKAPDEGERKKRGGDGRGGGGGA